MFKRFHDYYTTSRSVMRMTGVEAAEFGQILADGAANLYHKPLTDGEKEETS